MSATINARLAILEIASRIGRELRDPEPMPYPQALDLLGEVEDRLSALAHLIPEHERERVSSLSGRVDGFLPTRHPNYRPAALRLVAQIEDFELTTEESL